MSDRREPTADRGGASGPTADEQQCPSPGSQWRRGTQLPGRGRSRVGRGRRQWCESTTTGALVASALVPSSSPRGCPSPRGWSRWSSGHAAPPRRQTARRRAVDGGAGVDAAGSLFVHLDTSAVCRTDSGDDRESTSLGAPCPWHSRSRESSQGDDPSAHPGTSTSPAGRMLRRPAGSVYRLRRQGLAVELATRRSGLPTGDVLARALGSIDVRAASADPVGQPHHVERVRPACEEETWVSQVGLLHRARWRWWGQQLDEGAGPRCSMSSPSGSSGRRTPVLDASADSGGGRSSHRGRRGRRRGRGSDEPPASRSRRPEHLVLHVGALGPVVVAVSLTCQPC